MTSEPTQSLWSSVLTSAGATHDFSSRNLPYGVCTRLHDETFLCTRLGEFVIRLDKLSLSEPVQSNEKTWNRLMQMSKSKRKAFRDSLKQALLHADASSPLVTDFARNVFPHWECRMLLPCEIGDYTDFYCSRDHAYNVGVMFRGKDQALQPNWLHLPVGYHGRASSVIPSPSRVVHPCGQLDSGKTYGPSRRLDFELEIGCFLGGEENALGHAMTVQESRDRIFGYCLLNDWSARDVQTWEYVPLGPFCAKNFCTTISPWIVPAEALEEFNTAPSFAAKQIDPEPLPYLRDDEYLLPDVDLEVSLTPAYSQEETIISKSNFKHLYWTPAQMIAHHSSTGCNMRAGDLVGTGTISGPTPSSFGSMLELSWNGTKPLELHGGQRRTFLEDGDKVTMTGRVRGGGIGFGECTGIIMPPVLVAMKMNKL